MKYIDIMSDAISHFTHIPKDYVKTYIRKLGCVNDDTSVQILESVMQVEFPNPEGETLLEDLKNKDLTDTITFLVNTLQIYRNEVIRQSIVN